VQRTRNKPNLLIGDQYTMPRPDAYESYEFLGLTCPQHESRTVPLDRRRVKRELNVEGQPQDDAWANRLPRWHAAKLVMLQVLLEVGGMRKVLRHGGNFLGDVLEPSKRLFPETQLRATSVQRIRWTRSPTTASTAKRH
jgi:hypothetical protein